MEKALISLIFFSLLEAFFAISEIAFVSAEKILIERLAPKNPSARLCLDFWRNPEKLFTTTTLGITLSIAGNGFFTSYFLIKSLKGLGVFISSFILPFLILFFGQIFPKSIGKKLSYPLVLYLAPPLYLISFLFYPIYILNQFFTRLFLASKSSGSSFFVSKFREIFLTMIRYEEEIDYKEKELMHKILEFGKKKVSQVMIPLSKIRALPMDATIKEALEFSSKYNFTFIPLYQDELTQIKLIVKVQELIGEPLFKGDLPLRSFAKQPIFIPEIIPAHEALKILQQNAQEIAIVVDEYGLVSGLITIEDLIEEVLGEFRDSLDYYEPEIKKLDKNTYLVKGFVEIEKLQSLGFNIPSGDYDTLNGFLYHLLNRIPQKNEKISLPNMELFIYEAKPQGVEEIIIKLKG